MIDIKSIATLLKTGLNTIATAYFTSNTTAQKVSFEVYASEGDYKRATLDRRTVVPTINAILVSMPGAITPLQGLNNFFMSLDLTLISPIANKDDVANIFLEYMKATAGATGTLDSYAYVMNFTILDVEEAGQRPGIGHSVPMHTMVYFQFILNGVLSNNCQIEINSEEMIALDYSIARVRIPDTSNIGNDKEMRSATTQQGLQININIPYLKTNVTKELIRDILGGVGLVGGGDIGKTYTVGYTDDNYSISRTMILKDGTVSFQAGKVGVISLSFLLADTEVYV